MKAIYDWVELKSTIMLFIIWAVTSICSSLFLALWVIFQWLVSVVTTNFILTGIDKGVLCVFQVLFAISTLTPVCVTIYRDIRITLLQTHRKIHHEIEIGETHESK